MTARLVSSSNKSKNNNNNNNNKDSSGVISAGAGSRPSDGRRVSHNACYMPHHLVFLDLITKIIFGKV
jgi:hypothetical protein